MARRPGRLALALKRLFGRGQAADVRIELYRSESDLPSEQFRYRVVAVDNGEILAEPGEGHGDAAYTEERALRLVLGEYKLTEIRRL